jgi:hypothetical protein
MTRQIVPVPHDKIAAFCRRSDIKELSLFGSILRDDFGPASDVDVLVVLDTPCTLANLLDMRDELRALFGREVDLIVKRVIEEDLNPYRRRAILNSAQVIYHA